MQHTVATAGAAVTVAVEPHEHLFYQGKEIQENFVQAGDQRISRLTLNLKFYSSKPYRFFEMVAFHSCRKLRIYLIRIPEKAGLIFTGSKPLRS